MNMEHPIRTGLAPEIDLAATALTRPVDGTTPAEASHPNPHARVLHCARADGLPPGQAGGISPGISRKHDLASELQRLANLSESPGCLDSHLRELTGAAARLLGAEHCVIVLLSGNDAAADPAPDSAAPTGAADSVLSAPIRVSGRVIGAVRLSGVRGRPGFDHEDRWMLEIVTVYIGQSLQSVQLQKLLQSRFAQLALVQSVDEAVGRMLAGVPDPARMVTILARSFYREMKKVGFGANEIIAAASQIISELSASLKRHARRTGVHTEPGAKDR